MNVFFVAYCVVRCNNKDYNINVKLFFYPTYDIKLTYVIISVSQKLCNLK